MQKTKVLIGVIAMLTSVGIFKLSNIETVHQSDLISPEVGAEVHLKFTQFISKYGKKYTPKEKIFRLGIFYKNYMKVVNHNKNKDSTWRASINKMSDMTDKEYSVKYGIQYNDEPSKPSKKIMDKFNAKNDDPPAEKNWVTEGAVTAVKDEGPCGSGYAFGAIEPYESAHYILYEELLNFSVQQIVDCSLPFGNKGCNVSSLFSIFLFTHFRVVKLKTLMLMLRTSLTQVKDSVVSLLIHSIHMLLFKENVSMTKDIQVTNCSTTCYSQIDKMSSRTTLERTDQFPLVFTSHQ